MAVAPALHACVPTALPRGPCGAAYLRAAPLGAGWPPQPRAGAKEHARLRCVCLPALLQAPTGHGHALAATARREAPREEGGKGAERAWPWLRAERAKLRPAGVRACGGVG